MNTSKRTRPNYAAIATGLVGIGAGVAAYQAGFNQARIVRSLTSDLMAHQMIILDLRQKSPELVDASIKSVLTQINGVLDAA